MKINWITLFLVAVSLLIPPADVFARGGGVSKSGGFSGGGSSFFKSPPPAPTPKAPSPSPAPAPQKSAPPPQAPVQNQGAQKPAQQQQASFFKKDSVPSGDKKAVDAQKHEQSRTAFQASRDRNVAQTTSATKQQVETTSSGNGAKVYDLQAARARRVEELSRKMQANHYRDRDTRAASMYGSYHNAPTQSTPVYYGGGYNDSYSNSAFWYWLMSEQNRAERERYIYHHQHEIDPRRLQDMEAAMPGISSHIEQMRASGAAVDPNYVPSAFRGNEDLMFGDDVAQQAKVKASESGVGLFWTLLMGAFFIWVAWYLLFGRKWKVTEYA